MDPTEEEPESPSAKPNRRKRWIAGASVVAVGGVAIVILRSKIGSCEGPAVEQVSAAVEQLSAIARAATSRGPLDHQVHVRSHPRMQPYGPGRSERRQIQIPAHVRGPAQAA